MRAWLRAFWDGAQGYQRLAYLVGAMLFGVVLLRTANGLGPFDLRSASTAGYLVALGLLAAAVVSVAVGVGRRAAPSGT